LIPYKSDSFGGQISQHTQQPGTFFPGVLVIPAELAGTGKKKEEKSENIYISFLLNTKLKHLALLF